MSSQTLRHYQTSACHAVFDGLDMGYRRILYTQATGTGKTTTMAELCKIFRDYNGAKILCVAHRRELLSQMYQRIKDHCAIDEWQIGVEQAESKAPRSAEVIIASVQTIVNAARLPDFKPDVIIVDEAHRAAAKTYKAIFDRYQCGEEDGAILIGCTATAKRTDRQSLYAKRPDNTAVELYDKKKKIRYPADPKECVFDFHCFDYSIMDATDDGYLVPLRGHTVQTTTDLSGVETDKDGDFKEGQLAKAVDNYERTIQAINAWKEIAADRPTIVFCAGVEHAHHAAELWKQAGYTAAALDGETDTWTRIGTLEQFRAGRLNVLCNMGLFTEGMDAPACACVVHLRPTKSWNLYVQMTGRGLRPLTGVVDGYDNPAERRKAIAGSHKPDCIVLDLCDLIESNDICSAPSILDLPAGLDLQGNTVTDAKKLLDEFEEVRERVIGECPATFRDLQVRLAQVDMLRQSGANSSADWRVTQDGFRFVRVPPGYQAEMLPAGADSYRLTIKRGAETLMDKVGKPSGEFKQYLDSAQRWIGKKVSEYQETLSRGTLNRLSERQISVLTRRGHSRKEVDCMTYYKAKTLIAQYMDEYRSSQNPHFEEAA